MRLVFAGTPDFACAALERLHAAGFEIALVLTQPDRPAGRGMKLQASPVKQFAQTHGIPLAQPRSLRLDGKYADDAASAREAIKAAHADAMVVAAYGLILPQWVLDAMSVAGPPLGDQAPMGAAHLAKREAWGPEIWAVSTSTPRCYHAGAGRRPSTAPSRLAMRRPV